LCRVVFLEAFNSLSRDHNLDKDFWIMGIVVHFQLPLSGSPGSHVSALSAQTRFAPRFQLPLSGSQKPREFRLMNTGIVLSTPSLGITSRSRPSHNLQSFHSFQLPLSGSLGITSVVGAIKNAFDWLYLSTPSLGITVGPHVYLRHRPSASFNSLSRDH